MNKKKLRMDKRRKSRSQTYPKTYSLRQFQDLVLSFFDRRIRHYALSHIINYCGVLTYDPKVVRLIQQYPTEYRNLFNDSWWRSQHNPEELEMRKHPTRGRQWIGSRLTTERNDLIFNVFHQEGSIKLSSSPQLCRLCYNDVPAFLTEKQAGFCVECWRRYAHPYLNDVIAYSLDSNPN